MEDKYILVIKHVQWYVLYMCFDSSSVFVRQLFSLLLRKEKGDRERDA
jgi:hypothetical protein